MSDTLTVGSLVTIQSARPTAAGIWKVTRLLPKNVMLEHTVTGARCKASPFLLVPHSNDHGGVAAVATPFFVAGQTVTMRSKPGEVFVVLKPTTRGYQVAKLGGDHDRVWNCDAHGLTAVEIQWAVNA